MTKIVLADDHPIVRQGLRTLLERVPEYEVIGEAEDGRVALEMVERLKPDVLVIDVMMPRLNGLEVTRLVHERLPRTRVVIISMHRNEPYVLEALRNGASAYVLKTTALSSLAEAVASVLNGRRYLSPPLSDSAIKAYANSAAFADSEIDPYRLLTNREREIIQLAAEGLTNAQIGAILSISPRTAETHRANIMRKLELRSQDELVRFAIRRGTVDGD